MDGLVKQGVVRQVENAGVRFVGDGEEFFVLGPFPGGGRLVELGVRLSANGSLGLDFLAGVSHSDAATLENLRASARLLTRPAVISSFGVGSWDVQMGINSPLVMVLPLWHSLGGGSNFIVFGFRSTSATATHRGWVWSVWEGSPDEILGGSRGDLPVSVDESS